MEVRLGVRSRRFTAGFVVPRHVLSIHISFPRCEFDFICKISKRRLRPERILFPIRRERRERERKRFTPAQNTKMHQKCCR